MAVILRAAMLLGLALMAALVDGWLRPTSANVTEFLHPASVWNVIAADELEPYLQDGEALLIDARSGAEFEAGHVEGAIHCAPSLFVDSPQRFYDWYHEDLQQILVYCANDRCDSALKLLSLLGQDEAVAPKLVLILGGWDALKLQPNLSLARGSYE